MLDVLYEDEHLIAVDKPAGMLVHPSWLDKQADQFAVSEAAKIAGQKLHTLHRLDRPTSGVLLFGKHPEVARRMQTQFMDQSIQKEYICIARGWTKNEGVFDQPLKEQHDKIADKFADPDKPPQPAVTEYLKLGHTELAIPVSKYPKARYSLLLARPKTGRKHQIRRHFRKASHHLLGDTRFGDGRHNKFFIQNFDWRELCLRSVSMTFSHPMVSDQTLVIRSGLNSTWQQLLEQLGWQSVLDRIDKGDYQG